MDDDLPWDDEDETIEINLRPPAEVAARVLGLVALARRGFLEQGAEAVKDDTPSAEAFDIRRWVEEERLVEVLYPDEMDILDTPVGELEPDDTAAATWALGLIPRIPPYDKPADADRMLSILPAPWASTAEFRASARLRPEDEIAKERERAELWYDRADTYWWQFAAAEESELAGAPSEVAADLEEELAETAAAAHAAGLIPKPIAGDFPTRHGPYRDLFPDQVEELEAISFHRSVALNWLCGLTDD